jgi:hypothetical protein
MRVRAPTGLELVFVSAQQRNPRCLIAGDGQQTVKAGEERAGAARLVLV